MFSYCFSSPGVVQVSLIFQGTLGSKVWSLISSSPPGDTLSTLNLHLASLYIQHQIQGLLSHHDIISFIPNNSILPTVNPLTAEPLRDAVEFQAPSEEDTVELDIRVGEDMEGIIDVDKIRKGWGVKPGVVSVCVGGRGGGRART